jgi:subtilisin family serine protease
MTFFALVTRFDVIAQQYFVNSEWTATIGNDTSNYFYKRATVKTDASSNIYTLGSSITSTGYDFLLLKQNKFGDTLFVFNWNGDGNNNDVAMDMYVDELSEYVYIVGGSYQNIYDSLDAVIVSVDNLGNLLWYNYVSGTNPYNDLFVSIATDGSNHLVAIGTIQDSLTKRDFLITAFDFVGNEIEKVVYDYANHDDIAVKITGNGKYFIAGISEPNDSIWDYYVMAYKVNGGSGDEYRNYAGSGQLHRPTDAVYSNGYYYATGAVFNGIDYDIKTVCLDTILTVIWENNWGGPGINDLSHTIKEHNGSVYIAGATENLNGFYNLFIAKYAPSGSEEWVKIMEFDKNQNEVLYDIELDSNLIYVSGYINNGNNYIVICLDTNGKMLWSKKSSFGFNLKNDIAIDQEGNIIMAAPLQVGLITQKYNTLIVPIAVFLDSTSTPIFKSNEIIVSFDPNVVNTNFVDSDDLRFELINKIINDSTLIKMSQKTGIDFINLKNIYALKVFTDLKTHTLENISRTNDTVLIPPFWSTFRIILPDTLSMIDIVDSLNTIKPDILFSELNIFYYLDSVPNDPAFTVQASLVFNANYTSEPHINILPAWNISVGDPSIKVGVFDTGIEYRHDDFAYGNTTFGSLYNTKIGGMWDYTNDGTPQVFDSFAPDSDGHGTACAGVIGALTNNNLAISGIAGGDFTGNMTGNISYGATLYGFKIVGQINSLSAPQFLLASDAANAILNGTLSENNNGIGLHVMNMSWGVGSDYTDLQLISQQIKFAATNNVIVVCSRGNNTGIQFKYPACYYDPWVLNVGASNANSAKAQSSNFGGNLDFLAPGTGNIVKTLKNTTIADTVSFSGTSAAAPHVSGLASLMLSHVNTHPQKPNNLANEDIENLIQNHTRDIYTTGYDDTSGFGLINAGLVMEKIKLPHYRVQHFWGETTLNYANMVLETPNPVAISIIDPPPGVSTQIYFAYRYKITITANHNLPSDAIILDAWVRNNTSTPYGLPNNGILLCHPQITIDSYNNSQATLTGYVYYIVQNIIGQNINKWIPVNYNSKLRFQYTIHYESPSFSIEENQFDPILVYPNPTANTIFVRFSDFSSFSNAVLDVFDLNGKKMNSINFSNNGGVVEVNTSVLTNGVYILRVNCENGMIYNKKIIIAKP